MTNPINYASPATRTRIRPSISFAITLLAFTAFAFFTCLTIELLNARAGFYLPRKDFTSEGNNKWRGSPESEHFWRMAEAQRTGDPTLETRPLTPAEAASINSNIRGARINNNLQDAVSTLGLLQYPLTAFLALALIIACSSNYERRWKNRLRVALVLTLFCAVMMVYRGYFTSLGF